MPGKHSWTIPGSGGLDLLGETDVPEQTPRACVVLLHGFMGYKDYGFIPVLGAYLASRGVLVHRFNFAHSGMTNQIERFERADLFERQTWNAQVDDTLCVRDAINDGNLLGAGLPLVLIGHSRGGVTAILCAGRHQTQLGLAGLVTLAAPAQCCDLSEQEQRSWLQSGRRVVRSARTGQELAIASDWLAQQLADAEGHDVLGQVSRVPAPLLVVHGTADETVPVGAASEIVEAACQGARLRLIPAGNHVFGMPNPPDRAKKLSTAFTSMAEAVEGFVSACADKSL